MTLLHASTVPVFIAQMAWGAGIAALFAIGMGDLRGFAQLSLVTTGLWLEALARLPEHQP